jgi:hypothetical protein
MVSGPAERDHGHPEPRSLGAAPAPVGARAFRRPERRGPVVGCARLQPRILPMRLLPLALLLAACPSAAPDDAPAPIPIAIADECEGMIPINQHCLLPWPSDRWLVDDPSTVTGKRLQYDPAAFPLNIDGDLFDVEAYSYRDGFSPSSTILTVFDPDVDTENTVGLAVQGRWELSTADDSPTILLDLETGERVPHMVELDARAHEDDQDQIVPEKALLYLRPSKNLEADRSYAVALRNITLADGTIAQPNAAFVALRDGTITTSASLEARRARYDAMFAALEADGVPRGDLVQAWTFHTASQDNLTKALLGMRDDAMERIGPQGTDCTVDSIQENPDDRTLRRIDGTFTVPLYMDHDGSPARAVFDEDGVPQFQGWTQANFTATVPRVLGEPGAEPGRLLVFGHGLMGRADEEGGGGYVRRISQELGMVTVATDWQGMSGPDIVAVAQALADVGKFPATGERLMQGVLNFMVLTRTMKGACRDLPAFQVEGQTVIDGGEPYFLGISQGGIFGGTLMALSPDIARGALLVGGMNYPTMIGRSVDFEEYEIIFATWYRRRIDREILMAVMMSMWDFAEPAPWLRHIARDPLPGTPPKRILYQVARHDSQVPNLASDMAVREMGIPLLDPPLLPVWGIPVQPGPLDSAYVYYDTGVEPTPSGNNPDEQDNGAHDSARNIDAAVEQMDAFWRPDGHVIATCDGPCDPD